jgi:uncharacterized protein YecE (DUF72 family)
MLYIGTSGFSYKDWVGQYYPPGIAQKDMLSFYAREFSTCELNFTYYRQPDPRTLARMVEKVPPGFLFTVKAYQGMTHEREGDNSAEFSTFVNGIQPLIEAGKFGCVLLQFPWSFKPSPENRDYLQFCRERIGELPVVVEYRNKNWVNDKTFALLRSLNLGYCCVDEPRLPGLMPPVAESTADVAYVRFHGRNAAKWWQHEQAWERYNYTYSDEELREWVPGIQKLDQAAKIAYIFANNHHQGQAIGTVRQLKMILGEAGCQLAGSGDYPSIS